MDMTPDEIVVRYRQAKEKGQQLNILAELNACSVDDIVKVLVEHGGYKLDRLSRSRGKAKLLKKEESNKIVENLMRKHVEKAIEKAADKQLEKTKNITPVMALDPEPDTIPPVVKRAIDYGLADLIEMVDARRNRIYEIETEIAEFEKDIAALKAWKEEHI